MTRSHPIHFLPLLASFLSFSAFIHFSHRALALTLTLTYHTPSTTLSSVCYAVAFTFAIPFLCTVPWWLADHLTKTAASAGSPSAVTLCSLVCRRRYALSHTPHALRSLLSARTPLHCALVPSSVRSHHTLCSLVCRRRHSSVSLCDRVANPIRAPLSGFGSQDSSFSSLAPTRAQHSLLHRYRAATQSPRPPAAAALCRPLPALQHRCTPLCATPSHSL